MERLRFYDKYCDYRTWINGASFAKKLTRLNYNVYGIDVSQQTIGKAKELKIIVDGSTNPLDVISKCDTFIFCLYPTDRKSTRLNSSH